MTRFFRLLLIALTLLAIEMALNSRANAGGFVFNYSCWAPANWIKAEPYFYENKWPWSLEGVVSHELHWRPYVPKDLPKEKPLWRIYKPQYLGCSGQILVPGGANEYRWRHVYEDGAVSPFSNIRIVEVWGKYQESGCEGCAPSDDVPESPRNIQILIEEILL
jgi:hypothetical protein